MANPTATLDTSLGILEVEIFADQMPKTSANFIKLAKGKTDQLTLNITGVAETVQVSGWVDGAASGSILLQKF